MFPRPPKNSADAPGTTGSTVHVASDRHRGNLGSAKRSCIAFFNRTTDDAAFGKRKRERKKERERPAAADRSQNRPNQTNRAAVAAAAAAQQRGRERRANPARDGRRALRRGVVGPFLPSPSSSSSSSPAVAPVAFVDDVVVVVAVDNCCSALQTRERRGLQVVPVPPSRRPVPRTDVPLGIGERHRDRLGGQRASGRDREEDTRRRRHQLLSTVHANIL